MTRRASHIASLAAALGVVLAAGPTAAGSVYLNGVRIDGVTGQTFDNARVTIDAQGNVHIEAKGYEVRQVNAAPSPGSPSGAPAAPIIAPLTGAVPATAPAPPATAHAMAASAGAVPGAAAMAGSLTKRYWLVGTPVVGDAQFEMDVFVNSRWVVKLRSEEPQAVRELTTFLRPGPNAVVLMTRKRLDGGRRSFEERVQYRVLVGEGDAGGGRLMIDTPLVEYGRTAAELDDQSREFTVNAR
jgi:hypothetical protein